MEGLLALFSEEMEYCELDLCKKCIKLTQNGKFVCVSVLNKIQKDVRIEINV
jgi:hypothetical protein